MPPEVPPGPQAAPMAQPSPNEGDAQIGRVNVESAMTMLEQAVPVLGSNTPEGAAVLKALTLLSKIFARQEAQQLVPAQVMELMRAQQPSQLAGMIGQPPQGAAPMQAAA